MAFGRIISLFIEKPGIWPIFTLIYRGRTCEFIADKY
jgi:hypothetical protein